MIITEEYGLTGSRKALEFHLIFYLTTKKEDLFNEVNHGPMVVDNNIMLSETSILNASQGTAYAHNLINGKLLLERLQIGSPHIIFLTRRVLKV